MENIFFADFDTATAVRCLMGRNESHSQRICCLEPWQGKGGICPRDW